MKTLRYLDNSGCLQYGEPPVKGPPLRLRGDPFSGLTATQDLAGPAGADPLRRPEPSSVHGGASLRAILTPGHRIHNVQLKDGIFQPANLRESAFGDGEVDSPAILRALFRLGRPIAARPKHGLSTEQDRAGLARISAILSQLPRSN